MVKPKVAVETVSFVDNYCAAYQHLLPEVRSFEAFKFLHLGMISDIPRKSLPAIAKAVGLANEQVLHHFLTESPWDIEALRKQRLSLILQQLRGQPIVLVIDETGDRKKGKSTDYVDRQYIGNLGKIDNSRSYGEPKCRSCSSGLFAVNPACTCSRSPVAKLAKPPAVQPPSGHQQSSECDQRVREATPPVASVTTKFQPSNYLFLDNNHSNLSWHCSTLFYIATCLR